jgi:thiamine-monophosphate kinase
MVRGLLLGTMGQEKGGSGQIASGSSFRRPVPQRFRRHRPPNALTDRRPRPVIGAPVRIRASMSPRPGEADLIARYFAPLAGPAGLGLRDDAALLRPPPGEDLVLTTDALVAGVHFLADDPPGAIARKALRVNLSDLAAKAARPLGFLLTLALPPDWREEWLSAFAEGLGADALAFNCPLVGGDTVKTPGPLTLSVTAIGSVQPGRMPRRTGVRPGDRLYVTGTIGNAAIGLKVRLGQGPDIPKADKAFLLERYLTPEPRLALIAAMAAHASGGMDVSDGFAGDLATMLDVSGVSARVPIYRLPLSPAARVAIAADPGLFEVAATGGDDYELLASAQRESAPAFEAEAAAAGVPLTFIGEAVEGRRPPSFIGPDGNPVVFQRGAFSHF